MRLSLSVDCKLFVTDKVNRIRAPLKGLVLILACLLFNLRVHAQETSLREVANSSGWKALLYYQDSSFIITDQQFYLSTKKTLKSELEALIAELGSERSQDVVCRFPARYYFLVQNMGYSERPLDHCSKLVDFKKRAPLEKAYVMFASENISIPSSMMGHIYLKITGINYKNDKVEHALSFYTDVDGFNFPKLVVESLVLGKKGLYALTPSGFIKDKYLYLEGRNVWEFELTLTDQQRVLLQNHLFELKNINLTYYFHTFNCATLVKQTIRVGSPVEQNPKSQWTTPLDVVRFIDEHNLIAGQTVNLSNKWKIKSLIDSSDFEKETIGVIKENNTKDIIEHIDSKDKKYGFKALELAKTYNHFLLAEDRISKEDYEKKSFEMNQYLKRGFPDSALNFSDYKNPTKVKSTAQIMAIYANENDESIAKLTWLPGSHFLEDDSSNYISESELQISRITLGHNLRRNRFFLDEFNLYSATSFLPSDPLTNGLSGKFRMGYQNYFNSDLKRSKTLIVEGSLGKTFRLHNDVDLFGLIGLDFLEANEVLLSPDIESGVIIRAVYDMKTILSVGYLAEDVFKERYVLNYKLKHFFDFGGYGALLEFVHLQNKSAESMQNFSLGIKKYF